MGRNLTKQLAAWTMVLLLLAGLSAARPAHAAAARVTNPLDDDWRFLKADAPGAERPEFNDAGWRLLDVPHDWSIEGPFDAQHPTGKGGGSDGSRPAGGTMKGDRIDLGCAS